MGHIQPAEACHPASRVAPGSDQTHMGHGTDVLHRVVCRLDLAHGSPLFSPPFPPPPACLVWWLICCSAHGSHPDQTVLHEVSALAALGLCCIWFLQVVWDPCCMQCLKCGSQISWSECHVWHSLTGQPSHAVWPELQLGFAATGSSLHAVWVPDQLEQTPNQVH